MNTSSSSRPSLASVAVLLVAIACRVDAAADTDGTALAAAFDASGIPAQLGSVAATVSAEAAAARALCESAGRGPDGPVESDALLRRALAPAALQASALGALRARLSAADIAAAAHWYRSAAGRRIVAAERASAAFDEAFVAEALRALDADPDGDARRRGALRELLVATRTGAFVTMLNEGTSALVDVAARCAGTPPVAMPIPSADELSLYAFFVGIELIGPTAVVLRDIDGATLDAQLAFARTPAGTRWYRALVESTRAALERARVRLVEASPIAPADAGPAAR